MTSRVLVDSEGAESLVPTPGSGGTATFDTDADAVKHLAMPQAVPAEKKPADIQM